MFTDEIGYNIGEESTFISIKKIESLIEEILQLSDSEYELLSKKHSEVAIEKYGVDNVFAKFSSIPKTYVTKSFDLKIWMILSSLYFMTYKVYKIMTKNIPIINYYVEK